MAGWQIFQSSRVLTLIARFGLAALFLLSGIGKLLEPREEFIALVQSFHVIPDPLAVAYGTLLPWVEVIVAILLLIGLYIKIAATFAGLMLLSFIIAISVVFIRDGSLANCGCFGVFAIKEPPETLLARDGLFLLLVAQLLFTRVKPASLDQRW